MDATGRRITFDAVAREAGVSQPWLYVQADLCAEIQTSVQRHPASTAAQRKPVITGTLRAFLKISRSTATPSRDLYMRRLPALFSAVLIGSTTALTIPAPAEAAVPDVVRAVQNQMAKGATIRYTQYGTVSLGSRNKYGGQARVFRYQILQNGTMLVGKSGVSAVNTTRRVEFNRHLISLPKERAAEGDLVSQSLLAQIQPHRWVNTSGRFYSTGRLWTAELPKGKTWARRTNRSPAATAFSDSLFNPFEIPTLRALIPRAEKKRFNLPNPAGKTPDRKVTGFYAGWLSAAEWYDLSPTFREVVGQRPDASYANHMIGWKIDFDKQGLPFKFGAGWSKDPGRGPETGGGAGIEIQSWGPLTTIAEPRPAQAAAVRAPAGGLPEFDDLGEVIREAVRPTNKP
ncbi:hypothetical protein [Nonomuraea typhae]|uniref:hypothetical protein n=1 Tax=Nonomuraea typhae TaxID=2603600 RepID=UPI0012F7CC20|nr:hypothetical protein [Nonomuraea typhae]